MTDPDQAKECRRLWMVLCMLQVRLPTFIEQLVEQHTIDWRKATGASLFNLASCHFETSAQEIVTQSRRLEHNFAAILPPDKAIKAIVRNCGDLVSEMKSIVANKPVCFPVVPGQYLQTIWFITCQTNQ